MLEMIGVLQEHGGNPSAAHRQCACEGVQPFIAMRPPHRRDGIQPAPSTVSDTYAASGGYSRQNFAASIQMPATSRASEVIHARFEKERAAMPTETVATGFPRPPTPRGAAIPSHPQTRYRHLVDSADGVQVREPKRVATANREDLHCAKAKLVQPLRQPQRAMHEVVAHRGICEKHPRRPRQDRQRPKRGTREQKIKREAGEWTHEGKNLLPTCDSQKIVAEVMEGRQHRACRVVSAREHLRGLFFELHREGLVLLAGDEEDELHPARSLCFLPLWRRFTVPRDCVAGFVMVGFSAFKFDREFAREQVGVAGIRVFVPAGLRAGRNGHYQRATSGGRSSGKRSAGRGSRPVRRSGVARTCGR